MKKTASVYIPHYGCPNDCIFCNQVKISGKTTQVDYDTIKQDILRDVSTMRKDDVLEIAFFGGSFTAIEEDVQEKCLKLADNLRKTLNRTIKIKLSTRPDAIDEKTIKRLLKYGVNTVELGVQSLDEDVLHITNRGHNSKCVYDSSAMIKQAGIELGLQIMIGLPLDNKEKLYKTVDSVLQIHPDIIRIYPVLVIKDTYLEYMYNKGMYSPIDLDTAIDYATYMYKTFENAGIKVIRIGLQATENITTGSDVVAGPFHSAFGELVQNEVYKQKISQIILDDNLKNATLEILTPKKYTSKILGNKKKNYMYFKENFNVELKIKNHDEEYVIINNKILQYSDFLK